MYNSLFRCFFSALVCLWLSICACSGELSRQRLVLDSWHAEQMVVALVRSINERRPPTCGQLYQTRVWVSGGSTVSFFFERLMDLFQRMVGAGDIRSVAYMNVLECFLSSQEAHRWPLLYHGYAALYYEFSHYFLSAKQRSSRAAGSFIPLHSPSASRVMRDRLWHEYVLSGESS